MAAPSLADRLKAGETLISGWSSMPEPLVAEAVARAGFDCVTFDFQHGLHDAGSVMRGITAVAAIGTPAVVRVALGDNATAARVLDMGADAVIAPMINSAAEARALIAATKYPPVGERSWGPNRAMALRSTTPQQHLDSGNASALVFAMVETRRAVAALDEILAVEGLDGVFVGPSDLSVTFSDGKKIAPFDAALDDTIADIAARASAAGRFAGAFAANPERARFFAGMGYRLIALGSDAMYLDGGARAMLAAARPA
jgi:4-hydroxy-2-oxoheptanedioate aldolase